METQLVGMQFLAKLDRGIHSLGTAQEVVICRFNKANQTVVTAVGDTEGGRTGFAFSQPNGKHRFVQVLLIGEFPADLIEQTKHQHSVQTLIDFFHVHQVPWLKGQFPFDHEILSFFVAFDHHVFNHGGNPFNKDTTIRIPFQGAYPCQIAVFKGDPFPHIVQIFTEIVHVEDVADLGLHVLHVILQGDLRQPTEIDLAHNRVLYNLKNNLNPTQGRFQLDRSVLEVAQIKDGMEVIQKHLFCSGLVELGFYDRRSDCFGINIVVAFNQNAPHQAVLRC